MSAANGKKRGGDKTVKEDPTGSVEADATPIATSRAAVSRRVRAVSALVIGVLLVDQAAKLLSLRFLMPGRCVPVIPGFFSLYLTFNTGMAFGWLQDSRLFLTIVSLVAGFILPILIWKSIRQSRTMFYPLGLALVLGGNIGNLIDRAFRPDGVVDFIFIHLGDVGDPWWSWYPFNVADSAICIGIGLFVLGGWIEGKSGHGRPGHGASL